MEKIVEFNLGVGMNQLFPEPIKVVINCEDENVSDEESDDTKETDIKTEN